MTVVEAEPRGTTVTCSRCKAPMRPVVGRRLDGKAPSVELVFWRCVQFPHHVTKTLPRV